MSEKKQRPYKHPQINLRIPEELKENIQKSANKNNRSMNAEIIAILEDKVEHEKFWEFTLQSVDNGDYDPYYQEDIDFTYENMTEEEILKINENRVYLFTEDQLKEFIDNEIKKLSSSMIKSAQKYCSH